MLDAAPLLLALPLEPDLAGQADPATVRVLIMVVVLTVLHTDGVKALAVEDVTLLDVLAEVTLAAELDVPSASAHDSVQSSLHGPDG